MGDAVGEFVVGEFVPWNRTTSAAFSTSRAAYVTGVATNALFARHCADVSDAVAVVDAAFTDTAKMLDGYATFTA